MNSLSQIIGISDWPFFTKHRVKITINAESVSEEELQDFAVRIDLRTDNLPMPEGAALPDGTKLKFYKEINFGFIDVIMPVLSKENREFYLYYN